MQTDSTAKYFPYYQNIWNIIKFKPKEEQLTWFLTMSRMMFENMEKPKEPTVDFTTKEDRVVWDAYNTIVPAIRTAMRISKFSTEEFKERARINGKKGGRPRKVGFFDSSSDSWDEPEDATCEDVDISDQKSTKPVQVKDNSLLSECLAKDAENDNAVSLHIKKMMAKFPDDKTFIKWVRTNAITSLSPQAARDEKCLKWVYKRLVQTGFCDKKYGKPILNPREFISKISYSYLAHKDEILAREAGVPVSNATVSKDQQHEDAMDAFVRSRMIAAKGQKGPKGK